MFFKRVIYNLHRLFTLSILPLKYKFYLERGVYKYNESTSALYKCKKESIDSVRFRSKVFGDKSCSRNFFRLVFSKLYRVIINNDKDISFKASLMIISTSEKELKFFNFRGRSILTFYSDKARYNQIVNKRIEWAHSFLVPQFEADRENCTIFESLLVPVDLPYEDYLEMVCRDECITANQARASECNLTAKDIDVFLKYIERDDITSDVVRFMNSNEYKCSITHGDLWRSNLIWADKQLYYVDFEHVGERVFFYDIMMFLFSEFFLLDNKDAIYKYVNGEFDGYISLVFQKAKVNFNASKRLTYFYVFLSVFYYERWKVLDDKSMLQKLSRLLSEVNI